MIRAVDPPHGNGRKPPYEPSPPQIGTVHSMTQGRPPPLTGVPMQSDPSVGDLLGKLATETGTLVRQEVKLAAAEMAQTGTEISKQVLVLVGAAFVGLASLMALSGALIMLLAELIPLWLAALFVGAILAFVALAVGITGFVGLRKVRIAPSLTLSTMNENVLWAKELVR